MPIHNGNTRYLSKQNSLSVLGRPVSRTRLTSGTLVSTRQLSSSLINVNTSSESSFSKPSSSEQKRSSRTFTSAAGNSRSSSLDKRTMVESKRTPDSSRPHATTARAPRSSSLDKLRYRSSGDARRSEVVRPLTNERRGESDDLETGSLDLVKTADESHTTPLPILPAVPRIAHRLHARANTLLSDDSMCPPNNGTPSVYLQTDNDGKVQAVRTQKERDKHPDRINLDRRGLSHIPALVNESKLRLLSVQHNLVTSLESFGSAPDHAYSRLVFLDLYDNQVARIAGLDGLVNLRVLLLGKNRIKAVEGLECLCRLEVLDLHGNQIVQISNLATLGDLKVLNLAGNQIRTIGLSDLEGLKFLQELNLRRNRITKLLGFAQTPNLVKLFLNNNQIQGIEDMSSVASLLKLEEINVDDNPVATSGSCASYLVSYLPSLLVLNKMAVTSHVRDVATAWRSSYECSDKSGGIPESRRDQVIYNARTNWELLRTNPVSSTAHNTSCATKLSASLKDLRVIPKEKGNATVCVGVDSPLSARAIQIRQCKRDSFVRRRTLSQESASSSQQCGLDLVRLPPIQASDETSSNRGGDSASVSSSIDHALASPLRVSSPSSSSDNSSHRPTSSDSDSDSGSTISRRHDNRSILAKGRIYAIGGNTARGRDTQASVRARGSHGGITGGEFRVTKPPYRRSLSSAKANSIDRFSANGAGSSGNDRVLLNGNSGIENNVENATSQASENSGGSLKRSSSARTNGIAASGGGICRQRSESRNASKVREQGGDYLIEINGRYLNIYGQGSLRFIDRPWNPIKSSDVTTIRFNYINFNSLTSVLNKIKSRFPNVEHLEFKETNMYCLGQINAIADIQGLTSLHIHPDGNPLVEKSDWRGYAVYRLAHWGLKSINDVEVSEEESHIASSQFSGLGDLVLTCLPDSLLEPLLSRLRLDKQAEGMTAKQWLYSADPALKSVLSKEALQWRRNATTLHQDDGQWRHRGRLHLTHLIEQTTSATGKLSTLHSEWGSILNELVRDILVDYSQMDTYMRKCMDKL